RGPESEGESNRRHAQVQPAFRPHVCPPLRLMHACVGKVFGRRPTFCRLFDRLSNRRLGTVLLILTTNISSRAPKQLTWRRSVLSRVLCAPEDAFCEKNPSRPARNQS